jgi:hypothetical protein
VRQGFSAAEGLKRHSITIIRYRALAFCLGMIFSENRFTLFRIMPAETPFWQALPRVKASYKGRIPRRKPHGSRLTPDGALFAGFV